MDKSFGGIAVTVWATKVVGRGVPGIPRGERGRCRRGSPCTSGLTVGLQPPPSRGQPHTLGHTAPCPQARVQPGRSLPVPSPCPSPPFPLSLEYQSSAMVLTFLRPSQLTGVSHLLFEKRIHRDKILKVLPRRVHHQLSNNRATTWSIEPMHFFPLGGEAVVCSSAVK